MISFCPFYKIDIGMNALPARTMEIIAAGMHKALDSGPSYCSNVRIIGSLAIRSDSIVGRILKIRWIMAI